MSVKLNGYVLPPRYDPAVIETLIGLRLTYSAEWLNTQSRGQVLDLLEPEPVPCFSKKHVGNPARTLPYLIGILKQWKETGKPSVKG